MIYVDTNLFLFAILGEDDALAKASKSILEKIVKGELEAATSFLTWDELVWNLRKRVGNKLAGEEGGKFLKFPNLKFIPADENVVILAQDFAGRLNMKPRDAIHAASAASQKIKIIISEDPDFDNIEGIKRVPIQKFK